MCTDIVGAIARILTTAREPAARACADSIAAVIMERATHSLTAPAAQLAAAPARLRHAVSVCLLQHTSSYLLPDGAHSNQAALTPGTAQASMLNNGAILQQFLVSG